MDMIGQLNVGRRVAIANAGVARRVRPAAIPRRATSKLHLAITRPAVAVKPVVARSLYSAKH